MRFFPENVLFTIFDSYAAQSPSRFSIIALELTTITLISYERMEALCQAHHSVETFFRKLALLATAKMTGRIAEMLENDAAQRYHHFREDNPELMQRVSLGELAKYLGITRQSLSRIRAQR